MMILKYSMQGETRQLEKPELGHLVAEPLPHGEVGWQQDSLADIADDVALGRASGAVQEMRRQDGEIKEYHELRRCRYVGLLRYAIQAYLTAVVLNLKHLVRLLTGVTLRGRTTVAA